MTQSLFNPPFFTAFYQGKIATGAKMLFYETGTLAPIDIFDSGGDPLPNPISADLFGQFVPIYIGDDVGEYRVKLTTSTGIVIDDVDPTDNFFGELAQPTGSSRIGFIQAGSGAVPRTVQDRLRETISAKDFGAKGDGTTPDSTAINAAINEASARGAAVFLPAGTYILDTTTSRATAGGVVYEIAIPIVSDMHLVGEEGTVLKMADNISTDAAPVPMLMFGENIGRTNLSWVGIEFDMNGANNPISPGRGSGTYNHYNQSSICFSGAVGSNAGRGDGVFISNCIFRNTPGTNQIVMADTTDNPSGGVLGGNWVIQNCQFLENGLDTDDCTLIFAWANNTQIIGNTFKNSTPIGTIGTTGVTRGIEIHGADQTVSLNTFINSLTGVTVAYNLTENAWNNLVTNNRFQTVFFGVEFYAQQTQSNTVNNILVEGNIFEFDDTVLVSVPALNEKACISLQGAYGLQGITVRGNRAIKTGTSVACCFAILQSPSTAGQTYTGIIISDNDGEGLGIGNRVLAGPTNGMGVIDLRDNNWRNITPAGIYSVSIGDDVTYLGTPQPISVLMLGGSSYVDDRGSPLMGYGIQIAGTVTTLYMEQYVVIGATVQGYDESLATIANRKGFHQDIPYTVVWKGDTTPVTVGNGSSFGLFSLDGNIVTVNLTLNVGSTTVIPSGAISGTIPYTAAQPFSGQPYFGNARAVDSSAGPLLYPLLGQVDANTAQAVMQVYGGTNANNTIPFVTGTGDQYSIQIQYLRA